jgi:hypothetical protein
LVFFSILLKAMNESTLEKLRREAGKENLRGKLK